MSLVVVSGSYGGQIGLCIGFSFLSFVEFAYFYTWLLWREIEKLYHKRNNNREHHRTRQVKPFQPSNSDNKWHTERPFYNSHTDRFFLR